MSTIEKQWLQIFERQRWVINQAKQQAFLFDQDLVSKLIIAGITPPPSLFSQVLNHHELISEVPVPCTRRAIPFTGSHCCVFNKPVDTAHCRQLTNGLCSEHLGLKEGFDVGCNVLDLSQCPTSIGGCASNGVPQDHQEEDPSVTSPDERDARVSDMHHDSALQLARGAGKEGSALPPQCHNSNAGCASIAVLQDQKEENTGSTSPEDQKHAEIVCLLKISNGGCASNVVTQDHREEVPSVTSPADERDARVSDVYHGLSLTPVRGAGEEVSTLPQCLDHKENHGGMSPVNQRDARMVDIYLDPALSLARVQRSKSRQRALAFRNSTQKSCSKDKDNIDGYAGETIKCLISTPQSETVDELKEIYSQMGKSKIGEFQSKEKGADIYSGRITRSRSSGHQENSLDLSCSPCIVKTSDGKSVDSIGKSKQLSNHVIHLLELVSYPLVTNDSCREGQLKSGDHLSEGNQAVEKNSVCANLGKEVHTPEGLQEFEGPSVSNDDAGNSIVCMTPDEETHLKEDHHMIQKKEDGMGLEGVDSSPNAPFTFLYEEKEASVSFLIKQAADQATLRVDWVGFVHSPVDSKEVIESNLSTGNAAKPIELVSEECAVDSKALCNPHISTDADYAMVSRPGSDRILNAENLEVENPCAASGDELRSNLAQSSENLLISPEYVQSSVGDDREVGCLESTECQTAENSKGSTCHCSMEGTSHKHKRRKIEERVHDLSASVTLTEECLHAVKKNTICANLEREEHSPMALQHFQGYSVSQEDAGKLIVSSSPVEETHLYEDHMVESSKSLSQTQKKEVRMSLERVDSSPTAPFTFFHEEKEASLFSRLIMQAAGHPQDSMLEETGAALLQDDLKLENAEDFSCAGRTMLAKRFDFGGTSNFTEFSGGAPLIKSLDFTSADDAVFERFVMRTDDEPRSFTEEGISFDDWNLSNPAVERASILEQLCKSACMQTPVAYSSASCTLDKVQNLQRSVPNGVLELADLRTTLPINDNIKQLKDGNSWGSEEVGPAINGRSYSDCLLKFSGHSGWDTKKPYSSPIGKLWDRIASSSSSSGKRVSSIPELACIREENENADEVADTFQDGIVSEVLDCSPKRPPLADITDVPILPASVSKAVPYTDRFSLDSVTTEFSLTGTHKSVKKKPGIQNSTKRKYNNKENHSVSRGTKDIKMATGSLQIRYSKPKFSGTARKGGPNFSELEPKRNNIVSNITSFIPLVQQKKAAAALPGKRDIKVKSLEAAEAAKRLAERKDNERKMKKEAMKVERARVEQENLRKLELQRKRQEEERKKNEADMAAKKRQREEEDKKEKQRKRVRVEEGRREQREHEEKKRAEKVKKELKCQDGTERENKQSKCNTVHKKMDKERELENLRSISEIDPRSSCVPANNARRGTAVLEETNLDEATENEKLVLKEQSYDISPYKESDDEDEEDDVDDSVPNNKFIPSWASKNFLAVVASRQSRTDPAPLFPPNSFCCISEVLLPRKF